MTDPLLVRIGWTIVKTKARIRRGMDWISWVMPVVNLLALANLKAIMANPEIVYYFVVGVVLSLYLIGTIDQKWLGLWYMDMAYNTRIDPVHKKMEDKIDLLLVEELKTQEVLDRLKSIEEKIK